MKITDSFKIYRKQLKFTFPIENQNNNKISFLDITVFTFLTFLDIEMIPEKTFVYCKPNFSSTYLVVVTHFDISLFSIYEVAVNHTSVYFYIC